MRRALQILASLCLLLLAAVFVAPERVEAAGGAVYARILAFRNGTVPLGDVCTTGGDVLFFNAGTGRFDCDSLGTAGGLADPGGNGVVVRTGAGVSTNRTITGTTNLITVTNGDGVSGNPTLTVGSSVYQAGGTDVAVADGGTGGSTAAAAALNLGMTTTSVSGAGTAACNTWNRLTTGSGFTYTLPAAADKCRVCLKKDNDTDTVTIARASADTIDGATSLALATPYAAVCLHADGAGHWDIE